MNELSEVSLPQNPSFVPGDPSITRRDCLLLQTKTDHIL